MDIISSSVKQTQAVAAKLAKGLKAGDVVALIGNLGSGKTVFVKGLTAGAGGKEKEVLSPTFVLLRQYCCEKQIINHFDLYRLKDIRQLEQIGYEEYFYSDGITLIEWADRIEEALPREHLRVEFKIISRNKRSIRLTAKGRRYADNLRRLAGQAHKVSKKYKANSE
jgi:tRNA threonylcarbamoyladenosine biosynthesis protein TsaE